ncbi:MAG: DUF2156 domain-containing protein [Clostridia bacterium]|nr:DUF2156 domain-containing protein [Clostridia bacterium]
MIDFKQITTDDKLLFNKLANACPQRGCEMSFANLFLWGDQKIAYKNEHLLFLSSFSKTFYPFPMGDEKDVENKIAVINDIIKDSQERGIPCMITAVCQAEKEFLEKHFTGRFDFQTDDGSYDYVYDINDLSDLLGKKYHKKRNHLNNFKKAHPNYTVEPISEQNKSQVIQMVEDWYKQKVEATKEDDFDYERLVFERAMDNYSELGLEGLVLKDDEEIFGVTFASPFYQDVMDVHFEKARADVDGAYVAINNEFAKYIRAKYPNIKYLDREEDLGIEGLRKAKQSYFPHHQVVKYRALLKE